MGTRGGPGLGRLGRLGRLGLTKPEGVEDPLFFFVFFVSQLFDCFIGANWEKLALLTSLNYPPIPPIPGPFSSS